MGVGSRVVHKIFGSGTIEEMHPLSGKNEFSIQVRFDAGDAKRITGPGPFIRPEGVSAADA